MRPCPGRGHTLGTGHLRAHSVGVLGPAGREAKFAAHRLVNPHGASQSGRGELNPESQGLTVQAQAAALRGDQVAQPSPTRDSEWSELVLKSEFVHQTATACLH